MEFSDREEEEEEAALFFAVAAHIPGLSLPKCSRSFDWD
jgi:hypothetical protein